MSVAPIKWSQATSPILWSNIGIDWDTPAIADTPVFALSNGYTSSSAGAAFVGSAAYALNSGFTDSSILAGVNSVSFGAQQGFTSLAGKGVFSSATFGISALGYTSSVSLGVSSTATFPLSTGLTNASQSASVAAASYAVSSGYTSVLSVGVNKTANFALTADLTNVAVAAWDTNAAFALSNNYTSASVLSAVGSITLDASVTYINNMEYPESITLPAGLTFLDDSGFLWNDVSDVTTTWTKVDYPN